MTGPLSKLYDFYQPAAARLDATDGRVVRRLQRHWAIDLMARGTNHPQMDCQSLPPRSTARACDGSDATVLHIAQANRPCGMAA